MNTVASPTAFAYGALPSIANFDLAGKRVFIRPDLNVTMRDGKIVDDTRIRNSLPTIQYALDNGARVIVASHLGRPKGKSDPKYSTKPVAERLFELLPDYKGMAVEDCVGDGVEGAVEDLKPGQLLHLGNLRFYKGETENDTEFAKGLAALADVYINDAFGTSHRSHASTAGMAKYFTEKGVGLLMMRELDVLSSRILDEPKRPFVSVLGGAKVSDKLGVIRKLLGISDTILIGGMMAFTFLKAREHTVGNSKVEERMLDAAFEIMFEAEESGTPLLLPKDHMVAPSMERSSETGYINSPSIPGTMIGLDIGPQTADEYATVISGNMAKKGARTVFWNGPMGWMDDERYVLGTNRVAYAIAGSPAYSVVGGGDSIAALNSEELAGYIDHVSTGGGAMLGLVAGLTMPALEALKQD